VSSKRRAVFFDRDGTLIQDRHYLADPGGVELLPGAAAAIERIKDAGWLAVLITNQSGIGRGILTPHEYEAVHQRMVEQLQAEGSALDAAYYCPHAPGERCNCRKPAAGLFHDAARDLDIDLAESWAIGDKWRDVAPAADFGGRALLVPSRATSERDLARARKRGMVAESLARAADEILKAGFNSALDRDNIRTSP
jgi:D-glycero-D-manno-heptose 1,7-bisphosphate phosphatase